jgi:hypothetical protein
MPSYKSNTTCMSASLYLPTSNTNGTGADGQGTIPATWLRDLGVFHLGGTRVGYALQDDPVRDIGEQCAGEPHARNR